MDAIEPTSFGDIVKSFRKHKKVNQLVLAEKLGVHYNTLSKWERGICLPDSKGIVLELAKQLRLDGQETRILLEASLTAFSTYWAVPYQRNPFFVGRENILRYLHEVLFQTHSVSRTHTYALCGLGGIGKTQTAIEYACRYELEYTAIFWIRAEIAETIVESFLSIAHLLNLPERIEHNQDKMVLAVLHWLNTHRGWLLIYDNVEDLTQLKPFLPSTRGQGSLLFTTRLQVTEPIALSLQLRSLPVEEGALLLLRRTKRLIDASLDITSIKEYKQAQALSQMLGGLPLALDQAGAYILETGSSLESYLLLYRQRHTELLARRGSVPSEHPASVATTFTLAFERVQQKNLAAADLLRLCAFLAPDAIPEALILEGAMHLGTILYSAVSDAFMLNEVIETLTTLSLIQRDASGKNIVLHHLVQVILRASLPIEGRKLWMQRAVLAINEAIPAGELTHGLTAESYLPHALICATWIVQEQMKFVEADHLLRLTGSYFAQKVFAILQSQAGTPHDLDER